MDFEIDSIDLGSTDLINFEALSDLSIDKNAQKLFESRISEINHNIQNTMGKFSMTKCAFASSISELPLPDSKFYMDIAFMNGIANTMEDSLGHIAHLINLVPDIPVKIQLVYNNSNGLIRDAAEAVLFNFHGISTVAKDLREKWTKFHNRNQNYPYQKILHICHSAGALHTKIALQGLPEEIRNRVIVIAIAPATVIPKKLCYDSFNYCGAYDPIPQFEPAFRIIEQHLSLFPLREHPFENREELIFIRPKEGTPKIGHDFRHPMYAPYLRLQIKAYLILNGEYRDNKK